MLEASDGIPVDTAASAVVATDRPKGGGIIGEILVSSGSLQADEVREIVEWQNVLGLRFGDTAVQLGLINDSDLQLALARQHEYPYIKSEESNIDRRLFAAHRPFERPAELLRTLRSELSLRWFSEERRALVVLAPEEGEHGSVLAANLAVTFAQLGKRTLLVDANMRSPMQHSLFDVPDSKGLSNVLGGRCTFKSALIQMSPFDQLFLLCAGVGAPNPQELLASDEFASLLASAHSKFGVILIEAPPPLDCADAQLIAARTGGCLVVARRHHTRVRDLRRIGNQMSSCGAQVLGVSISD